MGTPWGYSQNNGPLDWYNKYPEASGNKQSPININTSLIKPVKENSLPVLKWEYAADDLKSLVNTGTCWRVDVIGTNSMITGGPLGQNIYKLEQLHCHWGCCSIQGSEHTVNGFSYSGELHLVHWNATKYKTFFDATSASDGLTVLSVFLKTGTKHDEINKITELLHLVLHKNDRITCPNLCDPGKLLPCNTSYWTYEGSLTTPPCSESVIWIIFKTPIEVAQEQLQAMRNLNCFEFKNGFSHDDIRRKVKDNFRPPLPLGSREVRFIEED